MSESSSRVVKAVALCSIIALSLFLAGRQSHSQAADDGNKSPFYSFESPQTHPLAITPDGSRLLALNTPDNRLSVFDLKGGAPELIAEIPVGLEPVSVAARNNNEAWVVNWLSDSVSIVDLTAGNVVRTIDVGDEPADIVFAGANSERAYVCVSGQRLVKTFDPNRLDDGPKIVEINGKQPRSLSRNSAGTRVFVSVFESGNKTTVISASDVRAAGGLPTPKPALSTSLPSAPLAGIVVKRKGKKWVDETGDSRWTKFVKYTLADVDIVVLDATSPEPKIQTEVTGVGTHIGNSVYDPASDRLVVVNTESNNIVRFEPKVKGQFIDARVSLIKFDDKKPSIASANLNPHINYKVAEGSDQERALSIGLPTDIVRAADGKLYVASLSTAKVGVLNSDGSITQRINVGQGPTGLAADNKKSLLYVLNRFDGTLSVVDLKAGKEAAQIPLGFNPEPSNVRLGRRFLYDGAFSAHGDVSCASCHRNGHFDGIAWDLGDPTGKVDVVRSRNFLGGNGMFTFNFHPMKGPMVTQSLRGIIGTEPLHWRGDRAKLKDFNGAFRSLLGGSRLLTDEEMTQFEGFISTFAYPPNPLQNFDRTYPNPSTGPSAERGRQIYTGRLTDRGAFTCNFCHVATPGTGTNSLIIPGQLLLMANGEPEPQSIKVPQLRGMYQKTGFENKKGKQLSGVGFTHDGVIDTLFNFLKTPNFTFANDNEIRDLERFVLSLDTGTAPSVGLQLTVDGSNNASAFVRDRLALLASQAESKNCDLVAKGLLAGEQRGFFYIGNGMFQSDRTGESPVSAQQLIQAAGKGAELTFTGTPVGTGRRLGIDRDLNGKLDGDK